MSARTLDNCTYAKKYGKPGVYNGYCEGLGMSDTDDEPPEVCKQCKLHYLNSPDNMEMQNEYMRTGY